ncbi:hypothetical protein CPB84DRAFT_45621 [Gymnopilus junonius]|uniref:Uncharacterized protein n=1 Tax=Gymnopilus junonius TaxID=109634 RepID=A0A9P5P393_GYMJU|nr:hypothetical protein CPB84DRAFT_45621 [Gymnopilus junonius]
MSIFVRPDSPPPRQPSPDILLTPLPCPHPRRVSSQPEIELLSPAVSPRLDIQARTIHSSRSFDGLSSQKTTSSKDTQKMWVAPRPWTHSGVKGRPQFDLNGWSSSSGALSPSPSLFMGPSANIERPSPSHLPAHSYPEPICSEPVSKNPVILRKFELEEVRGTSAMPFLERKQILPSLEKPKSMGMGCLRFFRLRSAQRQRSTAVTAL